MVASCFHRQLLSAIACIAAALGAFHTEAADAAPIAALFRCGDTMAEAHFDGPQLALQIDGIVYRLTQVQAADGAKYESATGNVMFWNKGRQATLRMFTQTYPTCRQVMDNTEPGAAAGAPALEGGEWVVETIAGTEVIADSRVTLSFLPEGRLAGRGSCNRYSGNYAANGQNLSVGAIAATRMACAPALMAQEQAFFEALRAVVRRESAEAGRLVLIGADDKRIVAHRAQ
jgi:heat shock protein HslJ